MGLSDVQIHERLERGLQQCVRSRHLLPLFLEELSAVLKVPRARISVSPLPQSADPANRRSRGAVGLPPA